MGWYDYAWDFPPYVSLAEKRARAASALARLGKKRGSAPEPIAPRRTRAIATTFWGKAWCENLERYMDFANRLPRGRSYVRSGAVVDLKIGNGTVEALVAGSHVYTVRIDIAQMKPARWRHVVARCTGKIGSLVSLLRGELSSDVLAALVDAREGLFPEPREITMKCSCPDWAEMCKHVAAVLYGVSVRLDERPELFFTLRQVNQAALLSSATSDAVSRAAAGGGKRIATEKLADVFGIEIDEETSSRPAIGERKRPPVRLRRGAGGRAVKPTARQNGRRRRQATGGRRDARQGRVARAGRSRDR